MPHEYLKPDGSFDGPGFRANIVSLNTVVTNVYGSKDQKLSETTETGDAIAADYYFQAMFANAEKAGNADVIRVLDTLTYYAAMEAQIRSQKPTDAFLMRDNDYPLLVPEPYYRQGSIFDVRRLLPEDSIHIIDAAVGVNKALVLNQAGEEIDITPKTLGIGKRDKVGDIRSMIGASFGKANYGPTIEQTSLEENHYPTNMGLVLIERIMSGKSSEVIFSGGTNGGHIGSRYQLLVTIPEPVKPHAGIARR